MSAVCVLTPAIVASWPVIAPAILGAAASLGFAVNSEALTPVPKSVKKRVETEIENSEVLREALTSGEKIIARRGDITLEFGVDERGACTICVTGERHSERELKRIGEEAAGRVVQQFAYHKLMTELKKQNYSVVGEEVLKDQSIHLRIRL